VTTARLAINNGGTSFTTYGILGQNAGSTGRLTVDGVGSSFADSSVLWVGYYGSGTLGNCQTVACLEHCRPTGRTCRDLQHGYGRWRRQHLDHTSDLLVGINGTGTLSITGAVQFPVVALAFSRPTPAARARLRSSGTGSILTLADGLFLGNSGFGALAIASGGSVSSSSINWLGVGPGSTGQTDGRRRRQLVPMVPAA